MPAVDVYYKPSVLDETLASNIKDFVSGYGSGRLGSMDFPLKPEMFSFKFHQPNEHDALTCDIIVRIHLRHLPDGWDGWGESAIMAERAARTIASSLGSLADTLHIGVEIVGVTSHWGSSAMLPGYTEA